MARPYRLQAENCFYHITSRGDDRKKIFLNERDYKKFLEYLKTAKEMFQFHLCAYCLMGNHYHLLIETTQSNLSKIMQYINTSYTIYYNTKHKRCGHLFQGRFKSIIVEADSYFTELTRYIHLNPIKAGIADSPEKYPWSSCNVYLDNKPADIFIDKHRIKELLAMDVSAYRQFIISGINNITDPFKNVYAGCILGSGTFIKEKLSQLQEEVGAKDVAYKRAVKNVVVPQEIINAVADYFKQEPQEILESNKRPMTAKKAMLYMLRRKTGLTNNQIGKLFNMKFAAVSKAILSFEQEIKESKSLTKVIQEITSKVEV